MKGPVASLTTTLITGEEGRKGQRILEIRILVFGVHPFEGWIPKPFPSNSIFFDLISCPGEVSAGNKRDEGDEFLPRQIYANVDRGDVESRGWKKKKKSVNTYGRERTVQPGPPAIHPSPRRGVEQLFERR